MPPPSLSPERAKVAEFYSARSATITPLPWSTFTPLFSVEMNVDSYRRRAAADRTTVKIGSSATTTDSLADNHDQSGSDNLIDADANKTKKDITT